MGWASGSRLMSGVITTIDKHVADARKREEIYKELIEAFEDCDADTLDECRGESRAYDFAFEEIHPVEDEEEC